MCLCHAWVVVLTGKSNCEPYAKYAGIMVYFIFSVWYVCPPRMYFYEFYMLPSSCRWCRLLWCWCKMRAASIDGVRLSVVCHSACLRGAVWTNDNGTAMTTWAQSTQHISLSLSPSARTNRLIPLLFLTPYIFSLLAFVFIPLLSLSPSFSYFCLSPPGSNWGVDQTKRGSREGGWSVNEIK